MRPSTSLEPTSRWFRRRVLNWAAEHPSDFPWRRSTNPYEILIAELLLHRTRADLVASVYPKFISMYPNAETLAAADVGAVETLLRPLGFVHRARRIPAIGRALVREHAGRVPNDRPALLALPGVGPYIANAVLALAYGRRVPLVDPNAIRVIDRVFGFRSRRRRPRADPELWRYVDALVPPSAPARFGLGLVDIGAQVCRRRPRCRECPLRDRCRAYVQGAVAAAPERGVCAIRRPRPRRRATPATSR